ncbi:hypothetical protein [Streptomyces sp. NPDC060194]|uniref:hypothetical protein n=1 Tax=Streptomyces sp. NPDC060194 TaxID=3347069 RepID=UPI00365BF2EB
MNDQPIPPAPVVQAATGQTIDTTPEDDRKRRDQWGDLVRASWHDPFALTTAVIERADAEQAELRARAVFYEDALARMRDRAEVAKVRADREAEALRTRVARVQALAADMEQRGHYGDASLLEGARAIRAALDDTGQAAAREGTPPTDPTGLRDSIADALMAWAEGNNRPEYARVRRPGTVVKNAYSRAAAVLAVLPATTDRATVLADVEHAVRQAGANCTYSADSGCDFCGGINAALEQIRRLADEAQLGAACTGECDPITGAFTHRAGCPADVQRPDGGTPR